MRWLALLVPLSLIACGQQRPGERKISVPADFALRSASIALPADAATAPLPELVAQNCTGCHSSEMITAQPPLDAKKWQAEIDKMRGVFKAPIAAGDDPQLIAALLALESQAAR